MNRRGWQRTVILVAILVGAASLRLYGILWDGGYLFHPDERQIMLVADGLHLPWPPPWRALLTPSSPWNPHFFSYGSLPMYLLRVCANLAGFAWPKVRTLESSFWVGRILSALFDLGTVYVTYLLGRRLYREIVGLWAAALVGLTVLHIQLAHFYVVDPPLAFFITLTVFLAVRAVERPRLANCLPLGVAWGCALATKVSAAPLGVPIALAWLLGTRPLLKDSREGQRALSPQRSAAGFWLTVLVAAATLLFFEPYALIDQKTFLTDVIGESMMASGRIDAPYTRQYIGTLPYLYLIWQTVVWGMGIPLGVAGFAGFLAAIVRGIQRVCTKKVALAAGELIPLAWGLTYFGLVGALHAKFLRYMLPMTPLLSLWAAWLLVRLASRRAPSWQRGVAYAAIGAVSVGTLLYALAYMNVYRQPHPWIQATAWLCKNLPPRSRIMVEHWDDPLPLYQGTGELECYGRHYFMEFPAYEPDDQAKLDTLLMMLRANDYIILASNRLYNTIPRLPERYPLTSRYYQALLGEELGFELIHYDAVYPSILGVDLVDDTFSDPPLPQPKLLREREAQRRQIILGRADESFTVYDHPKVLVFKKREFLDREGFRQRLGAVTENLPGKKEEHLLR